MKTLSIEALRQEILNSFQYRRKGRGVLYVLLGVLVLVFLGGCILNGMLWWELLISAFMTSPVVIIPLIFDHKQKQMHTALNNLTFVLIDDCCVEKIFRRDPEGPNEYALRFEQCGKFRDIAGHHSRHTEVGDRFYVLTYANNSKIRYVFSQKEWKIDISDFVKHENEYLPIQK